MIEIKDCIMGRVLYAADVSTVRQCLVEAVAAKVSLARADLGVANLREADLRGADLEGANLEGADLRKANLAGANLRRTNLARATLRFADLSGVKLVGADLEATDFQRANLAGADLEATDTKGIDLWYTNLDGINPNWESHDLIAAILFRAAGESAARRKVAGLIKVSRDWCWDQFADLSDDPEFGWAFDTLIPLIRGEEDEDDRHVPTVLRDIAWKRSRAAEKGGFA